MTADLEWKSHRTHTDSAWPGRNLIAAGRVVLFTLLSLHECIVAQKPSQLTVLGYTATVEEQDKEAVQAWRADREEERVRGKQINW